MQGLIERIFDTVLRFFSNETLLAGLIGFMGSIFGGLFTMWGVNRTLKIQNKEKFKETFTSKILSLDSIIEELESFIKEERNDTVLLKKSFFDIENTKPKKDNRVFITLIELSIKIDGEIYKKIRRFIEYYIDRYDDAIFLYSEVLYIKDANDFGQPIMGISQEDSEKINSIFQEIVEKIDSLISELYRYRQQLEDKYFSS